MFKQALLTVAGAVAIGIGFAGAAQADTLTKTYDLPNIRNFRSTDARFSWFTTDVHEDIEEVRFDWTWRDQGWGNRKGQIFAYQNGGSASGGSLLWSSPVAQHYQTTESFVFSADDYNFFDSSQLTFEYRVGGGGGHRLFMSDATVQVDYADPDAVSTPEPVSTLGFVAIGMVAAGSQLKRKLSQSAL